MLVKVWKNKTRENEIVITFMLGLWIFFCDECHGRLKYLIIMTTWRFGIFFWSCYVLCRVINDFLFSYFSSALRFSWGFSVITFDWMSEEISAFYWDNWNFDGKSFLVTKKFGFAIKVLYLKIKIEAKNQLWKEIEILVKKIISID